MLRKTEGRSSLEKQIGKLSPTVVSYKMNRDERRETRDESLRLELDIWGS